MPWSGWDLQKSSKEDKGKTVENINGLAEDEIMDSSGILIWPTYLFP